jgi:hypothetical protein
MGGNNSKVGVMIREPFQEIDYLNFDRISKDYLTYFKSSDQLEEVDKNFTMLYSSGFVGKFYHMIFDKVLEIKKTNIRYDDSLRVVNKKLSNYKQYNNHPNKKILLESIVDFNSNNLGIFTKIHISSGTIICRANDIIENTESRKEIIKLINDLNYFDYISKKDYCKIDNIKKYTNLRTIIIDGVEYLQAIKDIPIGEELSILYGLDFWFNECAIEVDDWDFKLKLAIQKLKYIEIKENLIYNNSEPLDEKLFIKNGIFDPDNIIDLKDGIYFFGNIDKFENRIYIKNRICYKFEVCCKNGIPKITFTCDIEEEANEKNWYISFLHDLDVKNNYYMEPVQNLLYKY